MEEEGVEGEEEKEEEEEEEAAEEDGEAVDGEWEVESAGSRG